MRQSPVFVAAILVLRCCPRLRSMSISSTSTGPDGTARYADPDDKPTVAPPRRHRRSAIELHLGGVDRHLDITVLDTRAGGA